MKEIAKTNKKTALSVSDPEPTFKGYTIEELRYQRALVTLQKEFCKSKLERNINTLKKTNPLSPTTAASSLPGKFGVVATKLLSGLNYLDYAMLGFSLFGSAKKVYSFFHRKKK